MVKVPSDESRERTRLPPLLYGTAWKEERTTELTMLALQEGFLGIDTANQRKHYHEAAVGEAVAACLASGQRARADLFIQTKFTYASSQDARLPYDADASFTQQVRSSFERSLQHLRTDYVDCYLLHGPSLASGLGSADWEVWRSMETLQREGRTRQIGVSNVSLDQLTQLVDAAEIKPAFVQNRCYATRGWDRAVRSFCRTYGIVYQPFSLLTANERALVQPAVQRIVARTGKTTAQVVFRFALELGMLPLTGTTSVSHMRDDLAGLDFALEEGELYTLENVAG
jgi:diketogulonate reductase-like aldo/keto reductase